MKSKTCRRFLAIFLPFLALLAVPLGSAQAAKLVKVGILDRDYLLVNISDGDVVHQDEINKVEQVLRYTPELNTSAATQTTNWTITSSDDSNYASAGKHPLDCSRKKKLSGHAEMEWSMADNDYRYEYTYEHWLYLHLPHSLKQGSTYTLTIGSAVNSAPSTATVTFDQNSSVSEAIHVNLVGYSPDAPHKAADLYSWMGSGGPRNYASFEGNAVYLYNTVTKATTQVGTVAYWKPSGSDVHGYNLTRSAVWNVDFSSAATPGIYRLVVDGVGCSQDFALADTVYRDPFTVAVRGYFYMRVGDSNPKNISPPPRTPRYIPNVSPANTKVYLTTMQPFHPDWGSLTGGDNWDAPDAWKAYRKSGNPTNPNAWGGHADAADWDRHLGHVIDIYDMLLPYLLTKGAINDDDLGISESGNGIPDIIDEARNEVDFWLRLRDGAGYSFGLTNPNDSNEFFQAGPTAIAAWANAANAAMLADAFRVAGLTTLMNQYRDAAIEAYTYASGLADKMLDQKLYNDEGHLRGRDLKMMAAAYLYNVTGDTAFEEAVNTESVCKNGPSTIQYFNSGDNGINQLYGTAAYLATPQTVHFQSLFNNMKTQIINEAKSSEADLMNSRPSRRSTYEPPSYWRTAHFVGHTMLAHAVATSQADRDYFRKALDLEADWGLGRNPLNIIEMTTATTMLAGKRSITEAATSGRDDGIAGVHPGHTPYLNLDDWWPMVMGKPSKLLENSFPANVKTTWPIGETYFPTRWVYAHTEYTPRQTMKGKLALYEYLYGLAATSGATEHSLTVSLVKTAGGNGTVTSLPAGIDCGNDCSEVYADGTTVTLTAEAASGSVFAGWDGACFGNQGTCEVSMAMNRTVSARFEPVGLTYPLTVTLAGTGGGEVVSTPSGISCGTDCSESYGSGTQVNLTATAQSGSTFVGWEGDCSGNGGCQPTMTAARSVTATFRSNTVADLVIYDEALASGWQDWSWSATINLASSSLVHHGSHSVSATLSAWGGFSPAHPAGDLDTDGYGAVSFWIHGGSANKQLSFSTESSSGQSNSVNISVPAGTWTEIIIPLNELGSPAAISRLNFFNNSNANLSPFYLDEIRLVPAVVASLAGDIDNDRAIGLDDAILALAVLVKNPATVHKEADVNGDDRIGMEEVLYILDYIATH